jgi:cytochrome P450
VRPAAEPVPAALSGSAAGDIFGRFLRMRDGEPHAALRQAVAGAVAGHAPAAVAAETNRQLDRLLTGRRSLDDIIDRLPPLVVGALSGLPDPVLPEIAMLAATFATGIAAGRSAGQVALARQAAVDLADRLSGRRFAALEADLAVANLIGVMVQSYEATVGLIGLALVAQARHPELAATDPGAFVDEVLRHDAPVQNTRRFMAEDAVIAGREVRAGQGVLILLAAANRDPQANPNPDAFRIDRPDRQIFTFGQGDHRCPARRMATMIAATALGRLAGMVPRGRPVRYRLSLNARMPVFG